MALHATEYSVPESEQRLLDDEEEKGSAKASHASSRRVAGLMSLRTVAVIQTLIIVLLLGALVFAYTTRDSRLSSQCAAYFNDGSKASTLLEVRRNRTS